MHIYLACADFFFYILSDGYLLSVIVLSKIKACT